MESLLDRITRMDEECRMCADDDEEECIAVSPDDAYECTRPKGHGGMHIACGVYTHCVASWSQEGADFVSCTSIDEVESLFNQLHLEAV